MEIKCFISLLCAVGELTKKSTSDDDNLRFNVAADEAECEYREHPILGVYEQYFRFP